jgi:DNA ligase D-like protein (predicted 3'-phosphoesterase)
MPPEAARGRLTTYRAKRNFRATPEPRGASRAPKRRFPSFVIQKHDATRLHYDFRLEDQGVLRSWAVPKGPSMDPGERRLAIQTEDHPLEYAGFEGNIPEGEYGAGPVIVWDRGYYLNVSMKAGRIVPMAEAVRKGHISVWLEGEKIKGGFSLVRLAPRAGETKPSWLLIKSDDTQAGARKDPIRRLPRSVLSGRTVEEVAATNKRGRKAVFS